MQDGQGPGTILPLEMPDGKDQAAEGGDGEDEYGDT
jgi:hypothetical protein